MLSWPVDTRRDAISVLLREEGLKARIGLIKGRDPLLSFADLAESGSAGLGGGSPSPEVGETRDCCCCDATQSVVDVVSIL